MFKPLLKFNHSFSSYFLLTLTLLLGIIGSTMAFSLDLKEQWPLIMVFLTLAGLFLLAAFNLQLAFLISLILLPGFFALDNLTIISKTYDISFEQNSYFSLVDIRLLGFLITLILAILFLVKKRPDFFSAPLSRVMTSFVTFICISAFWSIGQETKFIQVSFFLLLALLYFIAYFSVKNLKSFYYLIGFIAFISIPALLMAYYQLLGGWLYEYSDLDIKRITGPFEKPNQFGSLLLITSALSIILLTALKEKMTRFYKNSLWLYLFFAFPIFILTFSRSAWIGLVVFLLIFASQKKQLLFTTLVVGFIALIGMLSVDVTNERIRGIFQRSMFDSVYAREEVWQLSFAKFKQAPLIGYGAGSFTEVIRDAKESGGGTDNPHNDLVFFSVETGIIGVIGFIWLTLGFYYYLIKSHLLIRKQKTASENGFLQIISLGMIALMVTISTISFVESYYEGNFLYLIFWPLIGNWLAAANYQINRSTSHLAKAD
ncbi:MAG TPA: O-antigen ligase family protein [Candidatus Moranbacteria bacterium]|nr:O-antigen ligase family protein [Candidatus Moranbacteria bacterium]